MNHRGFYELADSTEVLRSTAARSSACPWRGTWITRWWCGRFHRRIVLNRLLLTHVPWRHSSEDTTAPPNSGKYKDSVPHRPFSGTKRSACGCASRTKNPEISYPDIRVGIGTACGERGKSGKVGSGTCGGRAGSTERCGNKKATSQRSSRHWCLKMSSKTWNWVKHTKTKHNSTIVRVLRYSLTPTHQQSMIEHKNKAFTHSNT